MACRLEIRDRFDVVTMNGQLSRTAGIFCSAVDPTSVRQGLQTCSLQLLLLSDSYLGQRSCVKTKF